MLTVSFASLSGELFAFAIAANRGQEAIEQVQQTMREPFQVDTLSVSLDVALGYTQSRGNSAVDALIREATTALTALDQEKGSHLGRYSQELSDNLHLRHSLEVDMQRALEREEFYLLVQPQVDASTLHIAGGEALIRWQHPTHGLVSPLQFIDLAEKSGFIDQLGNWVVHKSIELARELQSLQIQDLRVGINVSPRQFATTNLSPWITTLEEVARSEPSLLSSLELEITESSVMAYPQFASETLLKFRKLGLSVALDDFGTGHSSLAQLTSLPIDVLKLDRSLLVDIDVHSKEHKLASHLIKMAKDLGFSVVAEGIEDSHQIQFCQANGADLLQGFAFHKPMKVEDFLLMVIEEQILNLH